MRGKREALRSREGAARFGQNKSPVTGRLQGFLLVRVVITDLTKNHSGAEYTYSWIASSAHSISPGFRFNIWAKEVDIS